MYGDSDLVKNLTRIMFDLKMKVFKCLFINNNLIKHAFLH